MKPFLGSSDGSATPRIWPVGLAAAILLGAFLRLVWPADIEYKADEAWIFERTRNVGVIEPFPWLGATTSVGLPFPGMSLWLFLIPGKLFAIEDPPALARAVQILNITAIVCLVVFVLYWVEKREREVWLWAAALVSVNPIAVLFHRKIWQPSLFPFFSLLMLAGWWNRQRWWGAFVWGLVGMCLGQIHMSGFFFLAAFVAWATLFDRRRVAWRGCISGMGLGVIPMLPWLRTVVMEFGNRSTTSFAWHRMVEFKFWMRWVSEPVGLNLRYSLGKQFDDFLGYPLVNGWPTYAVLVLHVLLIAAGAVILTRIGLLAWRNREQWIELWIETRSPTGITLSAALWGFGILLTASGLLIHRHYLLVTFPLQFVWLARLTLASTGNGWGGMRIGRGLLAALCVVEALISVSFLWYIHVHQGAIFGDYGIAYGAQSPPTEFPGR